MPSKEYLSIATNMYKVKDQQFIGLVIKIVRTRMHSEGEYIISKSVAPRN